MNRRHIGSDNELEVSVLCHGTMNYGSRDDDATSYRMLDRYLDAGGNFIDTANGYAHWLKGFHGGESETLIGRWMKDRRNRDRLVIATKVGFGYRDVPTSLSADTIEREAEKSLKRLGIDTIDLYYWHCDHRPTPLEESLAAMDRLVKSGKVRCIGASNIKAWRLAEARAASLQNGLVCHAAVQQRFTYLRPRVDADFAFQIAANPDLMEYCRRYELPLVAYSPLLSGAYMRDDRPLPSQYRHADSDARMAAVRSVAAEADATVNQVVLAWMVKQHIIPIFGASRDEQMAENLKAAELALTDKQMEILNGAAA